jgi:hypothetical protein
MRRRLGRAAAAVAATGAVAAVGAAGYVAVVSGRVTLDLGIGRRVRPLGPLVLDVEAPRDLVFDVIAQPYLGRATKAQQEKVRVLERSAGMVLAAHFTPVGNGLVTQTVETVAFDRPATVDFRLVRGPVPYVRERFTLTDEGAGTHLEYTGELGTDGWALGAAWGNMVAAQWEATVAESLGAIRVEAERRARLHRPGPNRT